MAKKKQGPAQFVREVRQEGSRVTWTSRQETTVSTIMVLIMVTIAAIFFFAIDSLFRWFFNGIFSDNFYNFFSNLLG